MKTKTFQPGDPSNGAPERLELVRGFLNSIDREAVARGRARDELASWCASSGLLPGAGEAELCDLAAFREALRLVVAGSPAGETWRGIAAFARRARYQLDSSEAGLELQALGSGADRAIAVLLAVVYDARVEGVWERFKVCAKASCRWAFYDRSKNGSGRWCSMAVCGNRAKAAKRRSKL